MRENPVDELCVLATSGTIGGQGVQCRIVYGHHHDIARRFAGAQLGPGSLEPVLKRHGKFNERGEQTNDDRDDRDSSPLGSLSCSPRRCAAEKRKSP